MVKDWRSRKNDLSVFHSLPVRRTARFAIRLQPEVGKKLRDMLKAITTLREADKKIKVHRIVKLFVEPVAFFEYSAPKECCSCWDVQDAMVQENERVELDLAPSFERLPGLIHHQVIAVEDVNLRVVFKCLDNMLKTTSSVAIIGVQPPDNFTICPSKPLV
jgi:hypothetical protein